MSDRWAGDPMMSHRKAAALEDARWLLARHVPADEVADRVGVKLDTLQLWFRQAGEVLAVR